MSLVGQSRPKCDVRDTSAYPPIATAERTWRDVSNVPMAEVKRIHDWDARASEALANAKKLPPGSKRAEAIKKAGQLRVAADMKDLPMTKESAEQRKAAAV